MDLTVRQWEILHGTLLGDGNLKKNGKNAYLRLEHSFKQKYYMNWKYKEMKSIFSSHPKMLARQHPLSKRTYQYIRLQSRTSARLEIVRRQFYNADGKKIIPLSIEKILAQPLTIAVWYMDDGYYYMRDKSAHIYTQKFETAESQRFIDALKNQHGIICKVYCRPDRNSCQLNFCKSEAEKLALLIKPHVIASMRYKLPH